MCFTPKRPQTERERHRERERQRDRDTHTHTRTRVHSACIQLQIDIRIYMRYKSLALRSSDLRDSAEYMHLMMGKMKSARQHLAAILPVPAGEGPLRNPASKLGNLCDEVSVRSFHNPR